MAELDQSTLQAVNNANYKTIAEQGALASNNLAQGMVQSQLLAQQNAVAAQQMGTALFQTATAASIKMLQTSVAVASQANKEVLTQGDASEMLAALVALAGGQVGSKIAGNTPPESNPAPDQS